MEEQENQEQEKSLGGQIVDAGKNKIEQAAKDAARNAAKQAGQAVMKAIVKVLPIILPKLLIIAVIISIIGGILGGVTTYIAKQEVAKIGSEVSESIMSSIKMGDNGPIAPSKDEMIAQLDEKLKQIGIKKSDLEMGSESQANDYLYKYALASLSTQLPYIQGSEVQGIVKIKRCSADGTTKDLTFKKYSDFEALVDANDPTAVNYFAIDNNWQLCVAKHIKSTTTSTNGDETINTVEEVKIPYQSMVSQYSVPFEFLLVLQQISLNPEYVSAVADLVAQQGEIELTIFDSKETRTTEYTYTYILNKKVLVENAEEQICQGIYEHIEGSPSYLYYCNECGSSSWFQPRTCGGALQKQQGSGCYICEDCGKNYGTNQPYTTTCIQTFSTVPEVCGRTITKEAVIEILEPEEITETSTTVSEINTVTANITKANVWVIEQTAQYTQNNPETQHTLGEDGTTIELDDEQEPEQEGEWKTEQVETTKETINKSSWQVSEPNSSINPNKFLGLWRNSTGSYTQGADYVEDGSLVQYNKPSMKIKESPVANIINAKEMLYGLLENLETTQNHAQLMKYIIHYYETGKTLDIDLSIFNTNEFTEISYAYSTAVDFIRYWEGQPKETSDGTRYVVFDDGYGNPTVGWGIAIEKQANRIRAKGIDPSTLTIGATVDKAIIDEIEAEIIAEIEEYVINATSELDLEPYQIDALISRCYNCGMAGGMSGFVEAYKLYGNTQSLYNNLLYKPNTANGEYSKGLARRRKAEWELFNTGYYINTNSYYSDTSSLILRKAQECHDYVRIRKYPYALAGINVPVDENGTSTIDCSSYVSWVIYEVAEEKGNQAVMDTFKGHQRVSSWFAQNPLNWEKVSKENLQPGDIMVFSGHVQIYAGENQYFNCGSDEAILTQAPSNRGVSENKETFKFGLRPII